MANFDKNKKKTQPERVDPEFRKEMRDLAKFRYMRNLERKEPSFSEMTRLLRRTQSWKGVEQELRTKPKREDLI